jgi:hypothetical protein
VRLVDDQRLFGCGFAQKPEVGGHLQLVLSRLYSHGIQA